MPDIDRLTDDALYKKLLEAEGMTDEEFLDEYGIDSICPGICADADCLATTARCEPDARENWCHICEGNTVKSGMVLIGLI